MSIGNQGIGYFDTYTYVSKIVQGWIWGSPPSGYGSDNWPDPLPISTTITDVRIDVKITWSTVQLWGSGWFPPEAAVLVNVWLKIDGSGVDIYQNEQWEHYDEAILGIDIYFLHTGASPPDRLDHYENGKPVFVYSRYRENQASGTFNVPLLQILNDAVSDGSRNGIYFNLHDLVLYEVEAVVEEHFGYAAAKFSRLRVYYEVSSGGACPTLSLWSNSTWVTEGVMDIHVGSYNVDTVYRHYLALSPTWLEIISMCLSSLSWMSTRRSSIRSS